MAEDGEGERNRVSSGRWSKGVCHQGRELSCRQMPHIPYHMLHPPAKALYAYPKSSLSLLELEQANNEQLQNIKSSVQSLHSIYEDIYYAIKKEVRSFPPEWINIESFLEKRTEIFKPQMNYKNLKCDIVSTIESPMIKINLTELERLMDNLLSNAIKYANKDSVIKIEITPSNDKIRLAISNSSKKIKKLVSTCLSPDHPLV